MIFKPRITDLGSILIRRRYNNGRYIWIWWKGKWQFGEEDAQVSYVARFIVAQHSELSNVNRYSLLNPLYAFYNNTKYKHMNQTWWTLIKRWPLHTKTQYETIKVAFTRNRPQKIWKRVGYFFIPVSPQEKTHGSYNQIMRFFRWNWYKKHNKHAFSPFVMAGSGERAFRRIAGLN